MRFLLVDGINSSQKAVGRVVELLEEIFRSIDAL